MSKKQRQSPRRDQSQVQRVDSVPASTFASDARRDLQEVLSNMSEDFRQAQVRIDTRIRIVPCGSDDTIITVENFYQITIDHYKKLQDAVTQNIPTTRQLADECTVLMAVIIGNCSPEFREVVGKHVSNLLLLTGR